MCTDIYGSLPYVPRRVVCWKSWIHGKIAYHWGKSESAMREPHSMPHLTHVRAYSTHFHAMPCQAHTHHALRRLPLLPPRRSVLLSAKCYDVAVGCMADTRAKWVGVNCGARTGRR